MPLSRLTIMLNSAKKEIPTRGLTPQFFLIQREFMLGANLSNTMNKSLLSEIYFFGQKIFFTVFKRL